MAAHDGSIPPIYTTAVAIGRDKNSPHAVRWAIGNLVKNMNSNPLLILIHVKPKATLYPVCNGMDYIHRPPVQTDASEIFVPFRGYCARKGVQLTEVVLESFDICKVLLDYLKNNCISNIVVGGSTRNGFARKFKQQDVSATLLKSAPPFCSVYVVSKGKMISARNAQWPVANSASRPKQTASCGLPPQSHIPPNHTGQEEGARGRGLWRSAERMTSERVSDRTRSPLPERHKNSPVNLPVDYIDISIHRDSISTDSDISGSFSSFGSWDFGGQNLDFSTAPASPTGASTSQYSGELEAEMKRLKLELKHTMNMYSTACKEAISAKHKADQLHQWKLDEARKFEEARVSEEAALAIAEKEKAKCKAAIEAAEAAQKLAETEAQRRREAELKAKQEAAEKNRALTALAQNDVRYRKYTIDEIEAATDEFSESNKIGEGGYGPVYKGKLDHTAVAIKVLRPDAAQGRKQFQQEVEVLSCMRHPNMVLLLGACPEYGCLVYEYMDYGSLEDRLFQRDNSRPISWRKRFKIAAEIATALLFLHQAKPEPLVHRDLKPANILLDHNYVSKISDVGLARLVPPSVANSVTQYHLTSAAGTFCYIDPEYQQTGKLTTRSDIYSLGIMLLQVITAKTPMGLSHHVGRAIENGKFADMLDPTVPDWPLEEALKFAKLALKCTELRKKDRPDLGTVVLPELNRLRDLGNRRNAKAHSSGHNHSSSSRACSPMSRPHSPLLSSHPQISNGDQTNHEGTEQTRNIKEDGND